jgi:hypothetical protein
VLLLEEVVDFVCCFFGKPVLLLVFDEGEVAVLEVLRDDVSNEAGEVTGTVAIVEDLLELLPLSLIDQLEVIVLLVNQLALQLVETLLLRKDVR